MFPSLWKYFLLSWYGVVERSQISYESERLEWCSWLCLGTRSRPLNYLKNRSHLAWGIRHLACKDIRLPLAFGQSPGEQGTLLHSGEGWVWACCGLEWGSHDPDGELQPLQTSSTRLWWQEGWNSVKRTNVLCFVLRVGETQISYCLVIDGFFLDIASSWVLMNLHLWAILSRSISNAEFVSILGHHPAANTQFELFSFSNTLHFCRTFILLSEC